MFIVLLAFDDCSDPWNFHFSHILASPVYGVDHERVAIWGHHGYGGYLAGMALAIDKGRLLRCGVAGAPILNWHESEFVSDQYLGVHHADEIMNNMTSLLSNGANIPDHALLLIHGQRSDERRQTKELARRLELDDVRFESLVSLEQVRWDIQNG